MLSLFCWFDDTSVYLKESSRYLKASLEYHILDKEISPLAMLRRLRGNITQAEIAQALGVERNTVVRWENGRSVPKLEPWQTKKLCKILGISIDQLPDNFAPQPIHESLPDSLVSEYVKLSP